jgi:hypothetical protein
VSRNLSRERYRRLYLFESLHKNTWTVMARALESYLVKRAEDDGRLARDTDELIAALKPSPDEHAIVSAAVELLLEDEFLVERPSGIFVRNLRVAQGDEVPAPKNQVTPKPEAQPPASPRWSNSSKNDRSAAAKRAAEARWGTKPAHAGDASDACDVASGDASASHRTSHGDACDVASGDASDVASSGRAVSGQGNVTEEVFNPTTPPTNARATHAHDASASHASDASSHDASSQVVATATDACRIPKPSASPLSDEDLAGLEIDCLGMPRAFAEIAVRDWLREPSDPKDLRFRRQWATHAIKLVRGTWRDNRRRKELLAAVGGISDGPPPESVVTP